VATEAAWLNGKNKKSLRESDKALDTDRPSHGSRHMDGFPTNRDLEPRVHRSSCSLLSEQEGELDQELPLEVLSICGHLASHARK
jgi:hypothetical protein